MYSDIKADFIAEELLELTGAALLRGDFQTFSACFDLPLTLETIDGVRTLTTMDEFRQVFEAVRQHMQDTHVVDLVRTVISASFIDVDTIASVHVCNDIYGSGALIRPAYPVRSILRRSGLSWKITSCFYVILDSADHNTAIVGRPDMQEQLSRLH